jgi:hypothetical protein
VLDVLESRLRKVLGKHREFLSDLTVDVKTTRQQFVTQLLGLVETSNANPMYDGGKEPTFVKIAAIDVDRKDVHSILLNLNYKVELKPFFDMVLEGHPVEDVFGGDSKAVMGTRVVSRTHATLAHFKEVSQSEIQDTFGPLSGSQVRLCATSLLWDKHAAALTVTVQNETECGRQVPPSRNSFVHITVWFQEGASAVKSNDLPALVESGQAHSFDFATPITIRGTISLWKP